MVQARGLFIYFVACAIGLNVTGEASAGEPGFSDQTTNAGVISMHAGSRNSFIASGVVGDFNRDGFQDIYHPTGSNAADKLFINNGNGTFTDRTTDWGIDVTHFGTSAAVADYNNDGWLDIYVTGSGLTNSPTINTRLYRNTGNNSFIDVAVEAFASLCSTIKFSSFGGAFGDYDLDGDLDLVATMWGIGDGGNMLLANNGDGTFSDVTISAGLEAVNTIEPFSPRLADMNCDRFPELIWIGDFGTSLYFINDGDGTFTEFTVGSGTSLGSTEMGQTVADFNHDGLFDLYVTTISDNKLYINDGQHHYTDHAIGAGVVDTGWGWGTVGIDFDHDTRIDIITTSHRGGQFVHHNQSVNGNLQFAEVGNTLGLISDIDGRGLANFDYDNDGDQDIIIFPQFDPIKLFRNDVQGNDDTHWLRVFLSTNGSTAFASNGIGATVKVVIDSKTYMSRVDGGSNYLSQSELAAHFGIGSSKAINRIIVEWPYGTDTIVEDVAADQIVTITPHGLLFGDSDGNGLITITDFKRFIDNMTGDGTFQLLGSGTADFDQDNDIDLRDFASFQARFTGQP